MHAFQDLCFLKNQIVFLEKKESLCFEKQVCVFEKNALCLQKLLLQKITAQVIFLDIIMSMEKNMFNFNQYKWLKKT